MLDFWFSIRTLLIYNKLSYIYRQQSSLDYNEIKIIEKTHTQMVIHILIYIPHNYSAYQNDILQAFQILSISM